MEENPLSPDSSCEEVSHYFFKNFGISEQAKNILIKESISGDILLDIPQQDFKLFSIKGGPSIKMQNYLKENKEKLKPREICLTLSSISNEENIKKFLETYFNYKGKPIGQSELFELNEERMKDLGFNYGKRKRLTKYINHFKKLKNKKPDEDKIEINISRKSSIEEINEFLKNELKFSQNIIDDLQLDAESLFLLEEDSIEDLSESMNQEQKEKLR